MKTIKRILGLILIAAIVAVSFVIWQGYEMYSKAIAEVSVEEKAGEIMEKDHYTITQQLGRIMYFSQGKKYSRKVAEVLVAGRIEELYDKDKILELYVNTIYFGSGYYNVYDASMGYFGKKPAEIE